MTADKGTTDRPDTEAGRAVFGILWPVYRDGTWGRGNEQRAKELALADILAIEAQARAAAKNKEIR